MQEALPGSPEPHTPAAFGPLGRALWHSSRALAIAGSGVFLALVLMSIVSIVGRKLAAMPVPGDIEILQGCAAFAAASFFAYCHLNGGDVKVDFFTANASARIRHALDALGSALLGAVGALITWRSGAGALSAFETNEATMILDVPVWIGQALMLPGLALMAMAGAYMAALHLRLALKPMASASEGARS